MDFERAWRADIRKRYDHKYIKVRVETNNRRARNKGAAGVLSVDEVEELLFEQKELCSNFDYCKTSLLKFDIDHMHPVSRGGSNEMDNIQLLCERCNDDKSDLTHGEYRAVLAYRAAH